MSSSHHHGTRGYDGHGHGSHQSPNGYPVGPNGHRGCHGEKKTEHHGKNGMLLGATGGLAIGAVGGALIVNALNDSDDEHHAHPPAAVPAAYNSGVQYQPDTYQHAPPPALPPTDVDGEVVSSSDRESVQEAREEYEKALAEAADSDASSSDHEELEEAREEYYEE